MLLVFESFYMCRINIDIFRFTHLLKDDHVAESDIPSFIDALKQNKMHTKETFFIHKHLIARIS